MQMIIWVYTKDSHPSQFHLSLTYLGPYSHHFDISEFLTGP